MSLNEVSAEHKVRAFEFKRLFEGFGVTAGSLQKFALRCSEQLLEKDRLPNHAAQTASLRAVNAILQYAPGSAAPRARGALRFLRG
jgi:hypothetical protein